MTEYYNEKAECMSRDERMALQSERLKSVVSRVYENVAFYRKKMDDMGILPGDIRSIEDITRLPMTTKKDLRDNYPFGLFAAGMEDIVRIHASSGTTGQPTVVGYTRTDLENWAEADARALVCAGQGKGSVVQVAYGYGLFTGGLGMHYGSEKLGCATVPASSGNTKRQIMIMKDFGTTCICCTPSYLLYLAETMREMNIDPKKDLKLQAAILGAEPWTEAMRQQIENELGIKTIDIYGLSEITGPGVASQCGQEKFMHIQEDLFYPEILDTETLSPLSYGEKGELTFTTLCKEGMPLIRYRTRDITSLIDTPCSCGRTTVRMTKIMGRSDDMLVIRGINVFPSQIESVLVKYNELAPYYQILVTRENNKDRLEVQVELAGKLFADEVRKIEQLKQKLASELKAVLNITAKIAFVEPKTIQRTEGKASRVIDMRNLTE